MVVSAASGAVGQVVGQIAKIRGCRVVGIAGGAKKCQYVEQELGFDACIDHRGGDIGAHDRSRGYREMNERCPQGRRDMP